MENEYNIVKRWLLNSRSMEPDVGGGVTDSDFLFVTVVLNLPQTRGQTGDLLKGLLLAWTLMMGLIV
jgi:hypothetical protein